MSIGMVRKVRLWIGLILMCQCLLVHAVEVNEFLDEYQGSMKENVNKQTYPVELKLWINAVNQLDGLILSTVNQCITSRLSLLKIDNNTLFLRKISPNRKCKDSNLELKITDANTVAVRQTNLANKELATGQLSKGQASQLMSIHSRQLMQQSEIYAQAARQYQTNIEAAKKQAEQQTSRTSNASHESKTSQSAVATKSTKKEQPEQKQRPSVNNRVASNQNQSNLHPQRLSNLNGFWEVSGLDGTLSKFYVVGHNEKIQKYELTIMNPGKLMHEAGYIKNDIFAVGTLNIQQQSLVRAANAKRTGGKNELIKESRCRIMTSSSISNSLVDISHIANQSGAKVFTVKRLTPAGKICKYSEFSEWSCSATRCREYMTEEDFSKMSTDKKTIITNNYEFARQYSDKIHYDGKSYQELDAEMHRGVKQKEVNAYMNMWGVITGQPNEWARKYREEQNNRRIEAMIEQGDRQQAFDEKVAKTRQNELQIPDTGTCEKYKVKDQYNSFEEAALFGVKPNMLLRDMHDALLCNGFEVDAQQVASAGGLDKYLRRSGNIFYHKNDENMKRKTEISIVPTKKFYRANDPARPPMRVLKFSVTYTPRSRLTNEQWETTKEKFLDQYDVGGRKQESQYNVYRQNQRRSMSINLMAGRGDASGISNYHITICCGQ